MKDFLKKIINKLKIIALFIKAVIKKVLKYFTRFIYIIMTIGYIGSLALVYFTQDYLKGYNKQAIEYTQTANDGYKAYESVKQIDKIDDIVTAKLKEKYKSAEKNISKSIKNVDDKKLAREMLFGKKIEDTSFIKQIKAEIKNSFKIDISKEIKDITATGASNETLLAILKLLESEKILMMLMLLLSFPFLSPIVLAAVILTIMSKKYIKKFTSPNEVNYLTMAPSIYITNMVLSIIAVVVFYFSANIGLLIAVAAHGLFILKLVNGVLLRKMDECLSCGQKFPDELDTIKELKAK